MSNLPWGIVYRPYKVEEIVGNDATVDYVLNGMHDGTLSSRLLITGPSGSGKTTIAYLLIEWFTGLPYDPDSDSMCVSEINCASDRGIDKMRETIERVRLRPMHGKRHVVLLDEVQALTSSAAKALYKPLETEDDVVWILGTNEPEKLPDVLRSRMNRIVMRPPSCDDLVYLAEKVHQKEKFDFKFPEKAIVFLADRVNNVRLFLNTLQDLYQHDRFTEDAVEESILRSLDTSDVSSMDNLVYMITNGKPKVAVNIMSVYTFWSELLVYAECVDNNVGGDAAAPNYIRQMFTKKLKASANRRRVATVLHKLQVGKNMVTVGGCDGTAAFADLFMFGID